MTPKGVAPGTWIAVTAGNSPDSNPLLIGYGDFSSKADAMAWAKHQDQPPLGG